MLANPNDLRFHVELQRAFDEGLRLGYAGEDLYRHVADKFPDPDTAENAREQGYDEGYDEGYEQGAGDGQANFDEGHENGYASGYDAGQRYVTDYLESLR